MVYFECHYFDVSGSPPAWIARSHVGFMGSARKVDGQWLFSDVHAKCHRSRSRNCSTIAKAAFAERGLAGSIS